MEHLLKQILAETQKTNEKIDGLEKRMDRIEKRMDGIEVRMDGIETRMDGMEKRMDHLEREVGDLKNGQDDLEREVSGLKNGQDDLKDSFTQLEKNIIHGVGFYIDTVASHFDEKTNQLEESDKDQQQMIDTLASRSVYHESELNKLKQIVNN